RNTRRPPSRSAPTRLQHHLLETTPNRILKRSVIAGQNSEFEIDGIQQQLDGRNLIVLGGDLAAGPEPRRGGSGSGEAHRPAVHRDGAQRRRRRGLLWRW
ncbi:hypothetical protein ABZ355_30645, partial [Streptomyces sp. NPDC005989]